MATGVRFCLSYDCFNLTCNNALNERKRDIVMNVALPLQ